MKRDTPSVPRGFQPELSYRRPRRRFLQVATALTGSVALPALYSQRASAESPPETTRIRLDVFPISCLAPQFVAETLLKAEGFTDVQYIRFDASEMGTFGSEKTGTTGSGKVDMALEAVGPPITYLDAGAPIVLLAGIHLGCYELFGTERVSAIRDLKGRTVPIEAIGVHKHVLLSSMAAYVGLDPRKDINWLVCSSADGMKLLAEGKVDAFLGFPPEPQELRARKIGHVIVNTATDKPWSQYFCCMLVANRDFVRRFPIATKRAVRAILKAVDLCASDPEGVARFLVAKGYTQNYEFALETLKEVRYDAWRTYDAENTVRFHALRLHEVGMIKASPERIIEKGTDWRFLNELKNELKS
jgi:NitT/TauT family transport system substrate-binding protein